MRFSLHMKQLFNPLQKNMDRRYKARYTPDTMATVLQNVGHFGYEDGKPKAGYPHDVAVTVNNLPPQTLK